MNKKFISNSNYIFRKVLNSEACLDILKDFIESILNIEIKEIILNPYLNEISRYLPKEENFGIADVRIKTNENEEINVGIQFVDGIYYIQTKILLYYSQIHLNQMEYKPQREFARTATINIIDCNCFTSPQYSKVIRVQSNESNIKLDELEMHVIELPKFKIENIENMSRKEQWVTYIKGENQELIEEIKKQNKNIEKLDNLVEKYWHEEKME